jgi:hypothetical protein
VFHNDLADFEGVSTDASCWLHDVRICPFFIVLQAAQFNWVSGPCSLRCFTSPLQKENRSPSTKRAYGKDSKIKAHLASLGNRKVCASFSPVF